MREERSVKREFKAAAAVTRQKEGTCVRAGKKDRHLVRGAEEEQEGWSYSSGGRSSSWGSRLSRGQQRVESSGSESPPPFSSGSYGVSYSGGCLPGPSFPPRPPARISTTTKKHKERRKGR
ncbi:hypothetical protein EYF80_039486 [Liparis tanakae]|uniref:Uncharacterized protein n=1 Tax=Liparis tanakae TaxID=230148 RepID=A0A4Z2GAW5_9TELE|nr:hypothetical protein EYF80_039486 [Liparis tanakae]